MADAVICFIDSLIRILAGSSSCFASKSRDITGYSVHQRRPRFPGSGTRLRPFHWAGIGVTVEGIRAYQRPYT
jgi:hypothetical protein